mmetsp:Transcript_5109/g.11852  ORF Transcript_5109/g.11852 Transcript_5109/m.11852 type:complete len:147 (-) Transcript_5109:205-645(-)
MRLIGWRRRWQRHCGRLRKPRPTSRRPLAVLSRRRTTMRTEQPRQSATATMANAAQRRAQLAQVPELRPLNLVTVRGRQAADQAKAINSAFIQGVRDEMRQQLRDVDSTGTMPFKPTVAEVEPASPRAQRVLRAQGQRAQDGIVAY